MLHPRKLSMIILGLLYVPHNIQNVSSTTLWCSTYSLENHVTSTWNQHSKFWEHSWATEKWISNNCLNWSGKCIQIFQNHLYNFTHEVIFIYSKNKFIISDTYILFQSSSYYSKHWTPITNFSWWQGLLTVGQYTPKLNSHNFYCTLWNPSFISTCCMMFQD